MSLYRRACLAVTAALVAAAGVGAPANGSPGSSGPTTLAVEGTLQVVVVDTFGAAASSELLHTVVTDDGDEIPVELGDDAPANGRFRGEVVVEGRVAASLDAKDLLPRTGSVIQEDTRAGQVAIASAQTQTAPLTVESSTVAPVTSAAVTTPAAHRAYVAVLANRGSVEESDSQVASIVDGINGYWTTESNGAITSFAISAPIVRFDSTAAGATTASCGMASPTAVWNEAATLFPGVSFATGSRNHLVVAMANECGDGGIAGIASVGEDFSSGGRLSFSMGQIAEQVGVHEVGHTFGLGHANLETCPSSSICEYYDLYSPMGLAISGADFDPPSLGSAYRDRLGVASTSEVPRVALTSGQGELEQTFALAPRSGGSGARGLLVTDPQTGTTYSVDWRSRTLRDASTFYGSVYGFGAPRPVYPSGVVVEREVSGGDTVLTTRTDGDRATGAFGAGTTFAPSSGLSITVDSIGSTAAVTVRLSRPPVQSATPGIGGTAQVGQTVTAVPGAWAPGATFTYDWRVAGVSTGATGATFVVPGTAAGQPLTVRVAGSASGYSTVTKESAAVTVSPGVMTVGAVAVDGTLAEGETLTASVGVWNPTPTFGYAWSIDGAPLGSSPTVVVPPGGAGKTVALTVTGTRTGYVTASATVTTTAIVSGLPVLQSAAPGVEGIAQVGRTVTASTTGWASGASFAYDWRINDVPTGATGPSYVIPPSAAGASLTVVVRGTKAGSSAATRASQGAIVAPGVLTPGTVGSSGSSTVGSTVVASTAGWPAGVSLTYQWERNGSPISGATASTLRIPAWMVGSAVRVVVRGSRPGYLAASSASTAATVRAGRLSARSPRITGTPKVGRTLKVTVGSWSPRPSFRYQWYANGKRITSKGTRSSFKLTNKQKGKRITVRVRASKSGYATVSKLSRKTAKVARR